MPEKMWGGEPFWGLSYDWDPDWVLTDRQKELRETLIELCEQEMRANAKRSDDELLYPRRNLELMGEHGFLALTVPEEYGGLGENHVALRDGLRDDRALRLRVDRHVLRDAHRRRCNTIMLRPTRRADREVHPPAQPRQDRHAVLLRPRDRLALLVPVLLQAPSAPTAATRSTRRRPGRRRAASPTSTSCRPRRPTSPATTTCRCSSSTASTSRRSRRCGTRSACAATSPARSRSTDVEIPGDQIVGPEGDGAASNDEAVDPWFLIGSSSVWNGITLGAIDIAKRHTTRKRHVDVGMRVADYPTIQDYVGEAVMDTNACRLFVLSVAQAMDRATDDNTRVARAGRDRARRLPALGLADQVRGGQEHRPPRRQDAPRLRRVGLQARHGARALRARRQGRLGDGPDQRGPAPVRRQGRPARLRGARLLEPDLQPARRRERGQEARPGGQARAGRAAASRRPRRTSEREPKPATA